MNGRSRLHPHTHAGAELYTPRFASPCHLRSVTGHIVVSSDGGGGPLAGCLSAFHSARSL